MVLPTEIETNHSSNIHFDNICMGIFALYDTLIAMQILGMERIILEMDGDSNCDGDGDGHGHGDVHGDGDEHGD